MNEPHNPMIPGWPDVVWGGWGIGGYLIASLGIFLILRRSGVGAPAWGAFIPIYNLYLLAKLAGWSGVVILALLIPIANLVVAAIGLYRVGRNTGRTESGAVLCVIGTFLVAPLGILILGLIAGPYTGPPWWEGADVRPATPVTD